MVYITRITFGLVCWLSIVQQAQSSSSIETTNPAYTYFDFYKNSHLKPCSSAQPARSKRLVPRRGGGAHSSGGGGGGGDTSPAPPPFVDSFDTNDQATFCHSLNGTIVMLPTVPTQVAFTPWWPTYAAHFVSLLLTYFGLWRTLRKFKKSTDNDMPIPTLFWIQLPIDIAKIVAWFVKAIKGITNMQRLSWISVVLWLVPWNYMWLLRLIASKRRARYQNCPQDLSPADVTYSGTKEQYMYQQQQVYEPPSRESKSRFKSKLFWAAVLAGIVAVVQWILTAGIVLLFYLNVFVSKGLAYAESSKAVSEPSSIAPNMPEACLTWLKNTDINTVVLSNMNKDEWIITIAALTQFFFCSIILVNRLMTHFCSKGLDRYLRTYRLLRNSAAATLGSLFFTSLSLGIYIAVMYATKDRGSSVYYTTNLTTTGGCTFAAVTMDKRWGFWDVKDQLPLRVAMAVLGVS